MPRRRPDPPRPVTGQLTSSGRAHWNRRSPRQLARPASSGGGAMFVLLLLVVGVVVVLAVGVPGADIHLR